MLRIRTATPADSSLISTLVNSAYRGDSSRAGWTTEVDLIGGTRTVPEKVLAQIKAEDSRVELLFETGKDGETLRGCVHLEVEDDALYLGMLTVQPSLQGKGYGKILIDHAETLCRTLGLARVRMTVIDRRAELLAFYERRGYKKNGKWIPFPTDDSHFGSPLVTDLKLLELEKKIGK